MLSPWRGVGEKASRPPTKSPLRPAHTAEESRGDYLFILFFFFQSRQEGLREEGPSEEGPGKEKESCHEKEVWHPVKPAVVWIGHFKAQVLGFFFFFHPPIFQNY